MLSDFIKEKTAHFHDLAEAKFGSKKIFEKGYSVDDYKKFLTENYRLISGLEPVIEEHLPPKFAEAVNFNLRKKLPSIYKDAEYLGLKNNNTNQPERPINQFEAVGMLYVLEGASLGGNVIKKQLQRTPGFENMEFHYLGMYGENLGTYWRQFVSALDQISEENHRDVLRGAEKAYRFLLEN